MSHTPRVPQEKVPLTKPCKNGHTGLRYAGGSCVECAKEKSRTKYKADPEKVRAQAKTWRENNPEAAKATYDLRRQTRPFAWIVVQAKKRAKEAGVPFSISEELLEILYATNPICPVTGRRMLAPGEAGDIWDKVSVDRFDPAGGYTPGNIVLLSYRANTMKSDITDPALFRRLAEWMEREQRNRT